MAKCLRLNAEEIKPLVDGYGSCIASDQVTVEGRKVGYMYRSDPVDPADSGWCFFAGNEPDEYTSDPSNFGVYDVNTIANYDPDIIPFLDIEAPCAFEPAPSGEFVAVTPTFEA